MNKYKVEITTANNKVHTETVYAEDEIKAIDMVMWKHKYTNVKDIKVV